MSYKGPVEDKSQEPLPRSLQSLLEIMGELEAAIRRHDKGAVEGLLPDFEKSRRRANAECIQVYSPQGATHMPILERYADALNRSMVLYGQAIGVIGGLTVRR
jgi:hypothetical protein